MDELTIYREPIKSFPEDELLGEITVMVAKIFETAGQSYDSGMLKSISGRLTKDIRDRYWMFSVEEIDEAFNSGVRKDYGDYWNLSVLTFNNWLRFYKETGLHHRYVNRDKPIQKQLTERTELTDGEKRNILIEGVKRCWKEFLRSGNFLDSGNAVCDFLISEGKLVVSESEWGDYRRRAMEEIARPLNLKALYSHGSIREQAETELLKLDENPKVESLSKKYAMLYYFGNLYDKMEEEKKNGK